MHLILRAESPAPAKPAWHNPDPESRGKWSTIYEAVTTWFCSSHDFNKDDDVIILYQSSLIKLEGSSIRYLGPSLRSAASLIHKAFQTLETMEENDNVSESTPGIFVYKNSRDYSLPEPYYQLHLEEESNVKTEKRNVDIDPKGSLFTYFNELAQVYYVPASRVSQGLVWFLQERFQ